MISERTVYARLKKGWSWEQAHNTPLLKKKGEYLTSEQVKIAENNGIKYITAFSRVKRGWPVERAITEKPMKRGRYRETKNNTKSN